LRAYQATIEGEAPLLQHRFGPEAQRKVTDTVQPDPGQRDFSGEWHDTCYLLDDGKSLYEPATHLYRAMVLASSRFKIKGKRGQTFKQLVGSGVVIEPDQIPLNVEIPENIEYNNTTATVYVDFRPVRVQRARVMRERLAINKGWKLDFTIIAPDAIPAETLNAILIEAGRLGIGDYRPEKGGPFGRFIVTSFQAVKE